MKPHYLFLLLFFSFNYSSAGENNNSTLAIELVKKLGYHKQFESFKTECYKNIKLISAEDNIENDPGYFYGFTPASRYWPKVKKIYEDYNKLACEYISESDYIENLSITYSESLSANELKEALSFYETEIGKKIIEANVVSVDKIQELISLRYATYTKKAQSTYTKQMLKLIEMRENESK